MSQDRLAIIWIALQSLLRLIGRPLYGILTIIVYICLFLASFTLKIVRSISTFSRLSLSLPTIKFKITGKAFRFPTLLTVLGAIFIGSAIAFYLIILKNLPSPKALVSYRPPATTKILARDGQLLYKIFNGDQNRTLVSLNSLPPQVIYSTLAIEDSEFFNHPGFSLRGIARALRKNFTHNTMQGGSTITQQLVKLTLLNNDKTYVRKIKELILALQIEQYFTKNEILTMYLNQVGYGGTAYGIEEASQYYFAKSSKDLNVAESALLAGLPQSPTTFSPFGSQPQLAVNRQHEVLRRMVEEGYIDAGTAEAAKEFPLNFASPVTNIVAPHFVMFVKDYLINRYSETVVDQGGLTVTTSLDLQIQKLAEAAVNEELTRLKNMNVKNAAVMVTRPGTGEILAMVGSRNYWDFNNDGQVNVALALRQPGSSIKVITYALALENGMTPATIIEDTPITYNLAGSQPYSPKNYDGEFHGKVTLRSALANSYNIPAVKTLNQLGITNMIDKAQRMGINSWTDRSRYGLSLTLGGGDVRMIDMAVVFGTLANNGVRINLNPIINIQDYTHTYDVELACTTTPQSNTVVQAAATLCKGDQAVKPEAAYLITDILSDNAARARAFGTNSVLNIKGHQVAVKTGTTNSLRDNWTLGYTPEYVVSVWVGNNDNSPMSRVVSGITGASPIWNKIMTALLKDKPAQSFTPPAGLVKVTICPLTGSLSCAECPNPRVEYFMPGTEPKNSCNKEIIERIIRPTLGPGTPAPEAPARDQILEGLNTEIPFIFPTGTRTFETIPTPKPPNPEARGRRPDRE